MQNILKWFKVNSMKPGPKKFQFMILGKSTRHSDGYRAWGARPLLPPKF